MSKKGTQRIERQTLNVRTHLQRLNRRTIRFLKSEMMHDAVIQLYSIYTASILESNTCRTRAQNSENIKKAVSLKTALMLVFIVLCSMPKNTLCTEQE